MFFDYPNEILMCLIKTGWHPLFLVFIRQKAPHGKNSSLKEEPTKGEAFEATNSKNHKTEHGRIGHLERMAGADRHTPTSRGNIPRKIG